MATTKPKLDLANFAAIGAAAALPTPKPGDFTVAIDKIITKTQIRTKFDGLEELAASIREQGIIQALIVSANPDGTYNLIAGERRLRAAKLAGLQEVPVSVKRGTDALQARRMQVAENIERKDLTAFEEAMGVIEDVERYGTKEAIRIWNRSEGWINKRTQVKKYRSVAKETIESGLSGDFEILNCLNQLEGIDLKEAGKLHAKLLSGTVPSREEARNMVQRAKAWKEQQKQKRIAQVENKVAASDGQQQNDPSAENSQDDSEGLGETPADRVRKESRPNLKVVPPTSRTLADKTTVAASTVGKADQSQELRLALLKAGQANGATLAQLVTAINQLPLEHDEAEWILWTVVQDLVLPALSALQPDKSLQYVRKLAVDLKGTSAEVMWAKLHPEPQSPTPPSMPDEWRF